MKHSTNLVVEVTNSTLYEIHEKYFFTSHLITYFYTDGSELVDEDYLISIIKSDPAIAIVCIGKSCLLF